MKIKFASPTGHNFDSFWRISYGGRESYGIRVGHGVQNDYIENVKIYGNGTIDLNITSNIQPREWVKNISACVLVHGRVRNVLIEDITMTGAMRSVMLYGGHAGKFLREGTEGRESFDAKTFPSFVPRRLIPVVEPTCWATLLTEENSARSGAISTAWRLNATALEPNFNLNQYEAPGNVIRSTRVIFLAGFNKRIIPSIAADAYAKTNIHLSISSTRRSAHSTSHPIEAACRLALVSSSSKATHPPTDHRGCRIIASGNAARSSLVSG